MEEALCFGWIDSKSIKRDQESSYQYFSRRKPKSNWSMLNKQRVEKLLAQGLMHEAGLKMVELAKNDGTWTALDEIYEMKIPEELEAAFAKNETAKKHFNAFPPSAIRGILEWISSTKRPETRQNRIDETVKLAAENIRANQCSPKK